MHSDVRDAERLKRQDSDAAAEAAKALAASMEEEEMSAATHMAGPHNHVRRALESGVNESMGRSHVFLRTAKGIGRYIFDPGSRLLIAWTLLVLLVTLVVSFAIPVGLAWGTSNGYNDPSLFMGDSITVVVFNFIAYLVFWIDMAVQFNLAVWLSDGSFLTTRRDIAQHYLRTWFVWDFVSSMPWEFMFWQYKSKLLRLLKLLRFGRLAQALSGKHLLRQYEWREPVNYEAIQLARFAVLLPLVLHIMGCGLYIVADVASESYDFRNANDIVHDSDFLQWVYGIYWAAMTVSTIGYGDVSLVTFVERGYAIVCMIVGASLYAYLVGALIAIVMEFASKEQDRREKLTAINDLMAQAKARCLPRNQQVLVRYFLAEVHALRPMQLPERQMEMSILSPPAAATLARHLFRSWLPQVWWLRTSDDTFIARLGLIVRSQCFAPREPIFRAGNTASAAFVLASGIVLCYTAGNTASAAFVLASGIVLRYTVRGVIHLEQCEEGVGESCFMFGQESLLRSVTIYSYSAFAATYVSLWRLDRAPLMALLDEFPVMR
ncbi:hypothetical protein JKP88DRAFT_277004 [Tribonema minus]|uniref:Cyclic nucleotide-binding domain-containing protein n=1 Tax=Tribonema minus TaxID=303371 RepID=A0A836CIA7_9STRA|nr:hypothetical protein JKP88DRAFT_277004 [Tribonema minus]